MSQVSIYREIVQEREAQDLQWGGPEVDDTRTWVQWLIYIQNQMYHIGECPTDDERQRFIKIAALAVAAVESIDRKSN